MIKLCRSGGQTGEVWLDGGCEAVLYDKPWRLYQYQWYHAGLSENIHNEIISTSIFSLESMLCSYYTILQVLLALTCNGVSN